MQKTLIFFLISTCLFAIDNTSSETKDLSSKVIPFENGDEDLNFDPLDVSAQNINNDEKPFITPGASSTRNHINERLRNLDSIVRDMPGTYTLIDPSSGSINVDIRGLAGFGRVNTMVDGVVQTFFGTSGDSSYHGESGTSGYGALIDENFLIGVDVNRGFISGSAGANALNGSANFRTISVDDVLFNHKNYGFMGKYSEGNNGLGPNGFIAIAGKTKISELNESNIGFLFAVSEKVLEQNYRTGAGIIRGISKDGDDESDDINTNILKQKPRSIMFKTEYLITPSNQLNLTYRNYHNILGGREIYNNLYQMNYRFNPDSKYADIKFLLAYNQSNQNYNPNTTIFSSGLAQSNLKQKNQSLSFDISEGLNFDIVNTLFSNIDLGINFLFNDYKKSIDFKDLIKRSGETTADALDQWRNNPFSPNGEQYLSSFYLDTLWHYSFLDLNANMNISHYFIKGFKPACSEGLFCFPRSEGNVKINGFTFNPSVMLSGNLDFYFKFQPFFSYSLSSRAPNVQEVFFSNEGGASMNPFLKPESNQTFQVGLNISKQNMILTNDNFGFKATYYYSKLKNYIYAQSFTLEDGRAFIHINSQNDLTMQGLETELYYDMGYFYTRLSYSLQNTNQPISETQGPGIASFGFSRLSNLPQDYGTFEFGTRLLKNKINLGVILKYTGKSKRIIADNDLLDSDDYQIGDSILRYQNLPKIPTISNLYLSVHINKYITLKGEIQNVFDLNYLNALSAFNSTDSQVTTDINDNYVYLFNNAARGRTYILALEAKF